MIIIKVLHRKKVLDKCLFYASAHREQLFYVAQLLTWLRLYVYSLQMPVGCLKKKEIGICGEIIEVLRAQSTVEER